MCVRNSVRNINQFQRTYYSTIVIWGTEWLNDELYSFIYFYFIELPQFTTLPSTHDPHLPFVFHFQRQKHNGSNVYGFCKKVNKGKYDIICLSYNNVFI